METPDIPEPIRSGRRARDKFFTLAYPLLIAACGAAGAKGMDVLSDMTAAINKLTTEVAVMESRLARLEKSCP